MYPNTVDQVGVTTAAQEQWRQTRQWLNAHRSRLSRQVAPLYPNTPKVANSVLLADPLWIPPRPVPLSTVKIGWMAGPCDWKVLGDERTAAATHALDTHGEPFPRYADAMRALSPPKIFQNRHCYGLRSIDAAAGSLMFGPVEYFANIDIGEAVAHEYADLARQGSRPQIGDLPFRASIGDPLDLTRRPVPVAISCLVLRDDHQADTRTMILHWRDPAKVASGGGLYQVAPVGMFQPSHDAQWNLFNDFDLWRSLLRELAEELLGASEDFGSAAKPIDYSAWPFARTLNSAAENGKLKTWWLGTGVDPLTLVCDLLCVVAIDAEVFDHVFAGLVRTNDEGLLITSEDSTGSTVGVPFDLHTVERFVYREPMQPAGAALLSLAWLHRELLHTGVR